ncbi:hypothetical protein POP12_053 [Pectobacterium phage POP12]|nr:hypothetical protein POP12_053 [Pectobacterium phage POP12]
MTERCAVCKQKMENPIPTPAGEVCSFICKQYVEEQQDSNRLNEQESLNEVQMLL